MTENKTVMKTEGGDNILNLLYIVRNTEQDIENRQILQEVITQLEYYFLPDTD